MPKTTARAIVAALLLAALASCSPDPTDVLAAYCYEADAMMVSTQGKVSQYPEAFDDLRQQVPDEVRDDVDLLARHWNRQALATEWSPPAGYFEQVEAATARVMTFTDEYCGVWLYLR
jgi:hypothetical protein